jgi:hypothetical protein
LQSGIGIDSAVLKRLAVVLCLWSPSAFYAGFQGLAKAFIRPASVRHLLRVSLERHRAMQ